MTIHRIYRFIATLGPFGYSFASGTIASIFTLPIVHILQSHVTTPTYAIFVGIFFISSLCIINEALRTMNYRHDPPEIVIDEVIGCLVTFFAIPFNAKTAVIGLLLFRFLDISKVLGIKKIEQLPHAWGIVLDDVVAGLLSNIILHIVINVSW